MTHKKYVLSLTLLLALTACSSFKNVKTEARYPTSRGNQVVYTDEKESIFGEGGLELFSTKKDEEKPSGSLIGVNNYLWQASLQTLSFIPIASADPFGGVILTDWYIPKADLNERFKTQVFLTGADLKASNVKVTVLKQVKKDDVWESVEIDPDTHTKMEDAILTKARELRIASGQ